MLKRLVAGAIICAGSFTASCGDYRTKEIETSRGSIQYKETQTDDSDFHDNLDELSPEQRAKIQSALAQVEPFIRKYVSDEKRSQDLLENLDQAFAAWMKSKDPSKESVQEIIDVVGVGLGDYSIQHLSVRWMSVTDEKGTELALVGDNPPTRSYPFASVRYRIEDGKVDFVGAVFEALKHQRESP